MAQGSHGPRSLNVRWTDSEGKPLWSDNEHRGMVLRTAELDENGNVVRETIKRVPVGRMLDDAIAWAMKEYG